MKCYEENENVTALPMYIIKGTLSYHFDVEIIAKGTKRIYVYPLT